jgi:hypothetical protein
MSAARHLRLVRPPDTEPPESHTRPTLVRAPSAPSPRRGAGVTQEPVAAVQGTLALLFTLPGGTPAVPSPRRALSLATSRLGPDGDTADEPTPTPRAELPDPRRWTARLVQASVEARQGDRPMAQLLRWTTREVYDRLTREASATQASLTRRRGTVRPIVRSLHLDEPADGVVEACAVVDDGDRSRAVALRLEGLDGRWLCTALTVL